MRFLVRCPHCHIPHSSLQRGCCAMCYATQWVDQSARILLALCKTPSPLSERHTHPTTHPEA